MLQENTNTNKTKLLNDTGLICRRFTCSHRILIQTMDSSPLALPPFWLVNPAARWRRSEVSRPRRVMLRFPSIIHWAAAASALVFNSPDNHIIPPPKREGWGGRRREVRKRRKWWNRLEKDKRRYISFKKSLFLLYPAGLNQARVEWKQRLQN